MPLTTDLARVDGLEDLDDTDRRLALMVWEATNLTAREVFEDKHWNEGLIDNCLDEALDEMRWVCDFVQAGPETAEENTPSIDPALGVARFRDWVGYVAETAPDWDLLGYVPPGLFACSRDPWLRRVDRLAKVLAL